MPDIAAIDGVTGPGRRTTLILGEVQEVTFKLKKKVIEIVDHQGNYGSYDLAVVNAMQITSDGKDFTLSMTSKEPDHDPDNATLRPNPKTDDPNQGKGDTKDPGSRADSTSTGRDPGKAAEVPKGQS